MDDVRSRYKRIFDDGSNTERMVFFSDAVFAIAMTLLVIDLAVPDDRPGTAGELLLHLWPNFLAYGLSFTIIAINWMSHYRRFRVIKQHDGRLMLLNLALLFFIALLPFPTSLLSSYGSERASVVAYAFVVGVLGVLQWASWEYSYRHGLVDASVDDGLFRWVRLNQLVVPLVFWLSIPIAIFWDGQAAMWFWFALFPANFIAGRISKRY